MSRKRHLRPEEAALWQEVARRTVPLGPARRSSPSILAKPAREGQVPRPEPIEPFRIGQGARSGESRHDVLPGIAERVASAPVAMDHKAFQRLRRGKLLPEARIDLHGMTLDEARGVLTGFILRSHAAGRRLVLVVTGKGRDRDPGGPIPERRGVLRHNVPNWLRLPPIGQRVLQITEAHRRHGGSGAYYVYLKRQR